MEKLGLHQHPDFAALRRPGAQTTSFHKVAARVLYRCDMHAPAQDMSELKRAHQLAQQRQNRSDAQLLDGRQDLAFHAVVADALIDHIREVVDEGQLCSFPSEGLSKKILDLPSALSQRRFRGAEVGMQAAIADACPDVEHAQAAQVVFKIVLKAPGTMKVIPSRAITGGRLPPKCVAVALYNVQQYGAEPDRLLVRPERRANVHLLVPESFGDLQSLRSRSRMWTKSAVKFAARDFNDDGARPPSMVSSILDELLKRKAGQAGLCKASARFAPAAPELPALASMAEEGLVDRSPCGLQWSLSRAGQARLCTLQEASAPELFLDVASDEAPTAENTAYQLLLRLLDDGWTWAQLPRSEAARRNASYQLGGAKVFYTKSRRLMKSYLLALLTAKRLKDEFGIGYIPHGRAEEIYVAMLAGIPPPEEADGALRDMELDVERDDALLPEPPAELLALDEGFAHAAALQDEDNDGGMEPDGAEAVDDSLAIAAQACREGGGEAGPRGRSRKREE